MVEQVHAEGRTIGSGGDAIGVETVVVTALIDGGEHLSLIEQLVEGTDVLEHHTSGEAGLVEERLAVELVPGVGVHVGLLVIPVILHVVIDGLMGESQVLLLLRLVEEDGGILQDISLGVILEVAHQWRVGMGVDIVVGVDEGDIVALSDVKACVTGIAETAILLVDHLNALVLNGPFVADGGTSVW